MGYLDYTGLQHLWGKLKEKFALKSHTHDDRYYTEAEVNSKLSSKVDNTEAGANGLINKLESGTAAPVDDDLIITQWANHTTATAANKNKYVRRPMSSIWNYIKGKADSVYQPKGSYAASGHTHDDRYYTESEMNTKLAGKSNTDHTHNTSSISGGNVNYAGGAGPIEAAHIDVLRANRLAFLPASGVKVEYSVDGGTTWVDYGATDTQKASLFAMRMGSAAPFYTGKHTKADECTTKDQLRITITPVDRYASVNMLYLWVSVAGTSATVNISRSTIGAKETFTDVRTDVPISGWSGPNEIRFSGGTFGGGSTQTSNAYAYRFTFQNKADGKGSVRVMDIRMYGPSAWGVPNNMMEKDHIYNWDANQNVQFPAQVAATKFNGSSTGVVDYGDSNGSTIKVGYNGASLTKDKLTHIAGYAKDGNQTVIKDVDRGVLQSWLNLNEMINTQLTTCSSTPSDNDFYISQYAGGGATTTTYHRRPISALWNYIKSKADAVYSAKSHTHTKSQITDFPTSLKNPTALTIQTNGATAATYDGSAAKTVNITKGNIGLGNVDNTADKNKSVASATKLTTARTVSGGSDITLSFNYDGSGNSTANIGFYSCKHLVGNTNNYPFHRFAKLDNLTGAYADRTMLVYITQDYNGGGFGICRLSLRTSNSSSASTVEAKWLVRSGLSADFVQVAIYNVYGKTYADAFIKINGIWCNTTISALGSGRRGIQCRTWTLVDSNEVSGTTATDKKTSSECWKTIAEAGVAIHKQEYSSSASAIDKGYVASADSANTSSSCTGNSASATKLTSSAGSAIQPVYFKDGKPVAGTYTLGDASSKIVRTLGTIGNTGWANKTTDDKYVPTMSFMTYWNGAYSSTSSNLQYCDRGRFGTIVTKNSGDYATAGHIHDDRYYTESETDTKLSGKLGKTENAVSSTKLLNDTVQTALTGTSSPETGLTVNRVYNNGYPTNFGNVISVHGNGSGQILAGWSGTSGAVERLYYRNKRDQADANWSDWKAIAFTDDKPASVNDIGNAKSTTFAYSKDGMNYGDYTWLAGWNGYELRAVDKNQFATTEHGITASGSNYVRFGNGIQICWGYKNESNGGGTTSFAVAFNNTSYALALTATTASNNTPFITGYTTTSFSYDRHGTAWDDIQWIAVGTWK